MVPTRHIKSSVVRVELRQALPAVSRTVIEAPLAGKACASCVRPYGLGALLAPLRTLASGELDARAALEASAV